MSSDQLGPPWWLSVHPNISVLEIIASHTIPILQGILMGVVQEMELIVSFRLLIMLTILHPSLTIK